MLRRTQRRLANLARLLLLAASLGAMGTGAIFAWKPDWILRFENWTRRKLHGSDWALWNQAGQADLEGDHARAHALMVELSERLTGVRQLDRKVDLLNRCQEWLWSTDSASGDREGRLRCARRMVAFGERNTMWVMRLGRVLCEDPATRREGIDRLQSTWDQVPGHPDITPTLVRALLAEGETARARHLLLASLDVPQSNWWTVLWQGSADAPPHRANFIPRVDDDGILRAEFTIRERGLLGFAIEPPQYSAFVLADAAVSVQSGTEAVTTHLAEFAPELHMCGLLGNDLVLDGEIAPRVQVVLPTALAGPDHEFALRGRFRRGVPRVLADLMLEQGAERLLAAGDGVTHELLGPLRDLRHAALRTLRAQVFWGNGTGFHSADSVLVPLGGESAGDELRLAMTVPLREPITELRLDLPEGQRLTFHDLRIELADEGGKSLAVLGMKDVASTNGVTVEGDALAVADPQDPWVVLRVPPGLQPVRLLRVQAVTR